MRRVAWSHVKEDNQPTNQSHRVKEHAIREGVSYLPIPPVLCAFDSDLHELSCF